MRGWTLSGRSCLARVAPAARRASPVARASPRSCWEVPDALGSPSRAGAASARLDAVGEASVTQVSRRPHAGSASATRVSLRPHSGSASVARAAPHAGAADHEHRLRASCQTVGIAAECVVTVRIISSLRVSVALILCG